MGSCYYAAASLSTLDSIVSRRDDRSMLNRSLKHAMSTVATLPLLSVPWMAGCFAGIERKPDPSLIKRRAPVTTPSRLWLAWSAARMAEMMVEWEGFSEMIEVH